VVVAAALSGPHQLWCDPALPPGTPVWWYLAVYTWLAEGSYGWFLFDAQALGVSVGGTVSLCLHVPCGMSWFSRAAQVARCDRTGLTAFTGARRVAAACGVLPQHSGPLRGGPTVVAYPRPHGKVGRAAQACCFVCFYQVPL